MPDIRNLNPDALGDLYEALAGFVEYLDNGEGYLSFALEQKMRAALRKARGEG